MNMQAVGAFLRGVREERGMQPADVVRAMRARRGVFSSGTLGKIERGEMTPKTDMLFALVAVLGMSSSQVEEIASSDMTAAAGEKRGREIGRQLGPVPPPPKRIGWLRRWITDVPSDPEGLTPEEIAELDRLTPEQRRRLIKILQDELGE